MTDEREHVYPLPEGGSHAIFVAPELNAAELSTIRAERDEAIALLREANKGLRILEKFILESYVQPEGKLRELMARIDALLARTAPTKETEHGG